jgi:hypothetical protein
MTPVCMNELMGENGRHLRIGTEEIKHARGEVNDTPRKAEGVDHLLPYDPDFVGERARKVGKKAAEKHGKPCAQGGIGYPFPLLFHIGCDLLAESDFLFHSVLGSAEGKSGQKEHAKKQNAGGSPAKFHGQFL